MPTLATAGRAPALHRAIDSVLTQEAVRATPIVVVNGPEADLSLVAALGHTPRIRLIRVGDASLPGAILAGRHRVDTPWFGELDDDDLLLPGALALGIRALEADPALDVVITNGFRRIDGADVIHVTDFAPIRKDPLGALLDGNWLLPGAWLCRTDRVGADLFERMPPYLECTYLAIRFALGYRIAFNDTPTVAWTAGGGVSGSAAYQLGQPTATERLLELELPARLRRGLKRHLAESHHSLAGLHRANGDLASAWKAHLRSLRFRAGVKYWPFTRHLVADALSRIVNAS